MGRLTLFAKGNLDLRDSLHSFRAGKDLCWNGINEILRQRHPGDVARVRHELWTRSDALLEASGDPPTDLIARELPVQPYSCISQFSQAVFDGKSDAVMLSIQPDVMTGMAKHRRENYLFYPHGYRHWPVEQQTWFREAFRPVPNLDCDQSMQNFEAIVHRIRQTSAAPILVYNMSSIVPGNTMHVHMRGPDDLQTRIRRFNLGLVDLSRSTGISIIDVDALVARAGADAVKIDAVHLSGEGCKLVAQEVVRILEDSGVLPVMNQENRSP